MRICVPEDYTKFMPPKVGPTYVYIGVDVKDIPRVENKESSIKMKTYFIVKWRDSRLTVEEMEPSNDKNVTNNKLESDGTSRKGRNLIKDSAAATYASTNKNKHDTTESDTSSKEIKRCI